MPEKPQRPGGQPKRAAELEELRKENAELRQQLSLDEPMTEGAWLDIAPSFRDRLAARAYVAEFGRKDFALRRLRFVCKDGKEAEHLRAIVFDTPGFTEIIEADLGLIEASKTEILAKTVEVALHGDDDAQVRAAQLLARVAGWQKTPDTVIDNRRINLYSLVGGTPNSTTAVKEELPPGAVTVQAFLDHEPGDPVRIDSGDDAVIEALES